MEAIKIYPELDSWKKNKAGTANLSIRFDYAGNRAGNERLNIIVKLQDWDVQIKRIKKTDISFEYINSIIEGRLQHHRNYFLKRQAFGQPITLELIKQYLQNGTLESFYSFASWLLENKKLKDGYPYSVDSKRRYNDEIIRMQQFRKVLLFKDLTVKFLEEYKVWLQTGYLKKDKKRLEHNSIWKALSFVRMVYNEAVKEEVIIADSNPFKKFKVGSSVTDMSKIKYLDRQQIDKLEQLLLNESHRLQELTLKIGWRFLAMCVTGLRISDAMLLNEALFNDAGDLEFTPYKTRRHGNKAQIPISSERQLNYLRRTLALPLPQQEAKSFRTTFNDHLNILSAMASLPHITSHVGRHTMGSFLVDANIEKKAAMSMLGVKKETVIDTYLHLKESKLKTEAEKLKNVF